MSRSRAAIVCPGPSAKITWPAASGYDHVIAVNKAAALIDEGWWLFSDPDPVGMTTAPQTVERLRIVAPFFALESLARDRSVSDRLSRFAGVYVREAFLPRKQFVIFSLIHAAMFAAALGAQEVDVFGADWRGTASFDGVEQGGRETDRWSMEAMLAASVFAWLRQRFSVVVRRVLPQDHPRMPPFPWAIAYSPAELDGLGLKVLASGELDAGKVRFVGRSGAPKDMVRPACVQREGDAASPAFAYQMANRECGARR